jgi:hypothetical protein
LTGLRGRPHNQGVHGVLVQVGNQLVLSNFGGVYGVSGCFQAGNSGGGHAVVGVDFHAKKDVFGKGIRGN